MGFSPYFTLYGLKPILPRKRYRFLMSLPNCTIFSLCWRKHLACTSLLEADASKQKCTRKTLRKQGWLPCKLSMIKGGFQTCIVKKCCVISMNSECKSLGKTTHKPCATGKKPRETDAYFTDSRFISFRIINFPCLKNLIHIPIPPNNIKDKPKYIIILFDIFSFSKSPMPRYLTYL